MKLAIEIDGSSHDSKGDYDRFRDEYFNEIGLKLIRFSDAEIKNNLDGVLTLIKEEIKLRQSPFLKGVPRSGGGLS